MADTPVTRGRYALSWRVPASATLRVLLPRQAEWRSATSPVFTVRVRD